MKTIFALALLTCLTSAFARELPVATLPAGARLAVIGDSITEQKIYTRFLEVYLLACAGRLDIHCFQFG